MTDTKDPNMGRGRQIGLMINFAMMGVLASSVMPLLYELAIETCYPLKAGLATGVLWLFANIAGTVWTFVYMRFSTDFYPSMQVDVLNNMNFTQLSSEIGTKLERNCYPSYNNTVYNETGDFGINSKFWFINGTTSQNGKMEKWNKKMVNGESKMGYTPTGKHRFGMPIQVKFKEDDVVQDVSVGCLKLLQETKEHWTFEDSCGILATKTVGGQCKLYQNAPFRIQAMKYYGESYWYSFLAYAGVSIIFAYFYKRVDQKCETFF